MACLILNTVGPEDRFLSSLRLIEPIAHAMLDGALSVGIPTFENQNGRMMEGSGGASILDLLARDGKRMSVFRAYVFPYMDRPNLTVPHSRTGHPTDL